MKQALKIVIASALATAVAVKAVPALAEPAPAQATVVVGTADLDLTTAAGKGILERRLVAAAREACGKAADVDLSGSNAVRQCRAELLAQARARSEQLASNGAPFVIAYR